METFVVQIQAQNRIVIPKTVCDLMNLRKGEYVRLAIERVDTANHR